MCSTSNWSGVDFERLFVGSLGQREIAGFLVDHAQIHVCLAGIGTEPGGLRICLGGLLQVAGLLLGHAQIKPAVEALRRVFGQLGAVAQRRVVIAGGERAGRQAFKRGLRIGPERSSFSE